MSDSLDRLREEFLAETEDTLADFHQDLRSLDTAREAGPLPAELVDRAFRTTHSLKGVAAMFGLEAMSSVAHALESVLDGFRQGRFPPDDETFALLFDGQAALHALRSSAGADEAREHEQADRILAAVANAVRARMRTRNTFDDTLARLPREESAEIARARSASRTAALIEWTLTEPGGEAKFLEVLAAIGRWGRAVGTVTTEREEEPGAYLARTIAIGDAPLFQLIREVAPLGGQVTLPEEPARPPTSATVAADAPSASAGSESSAPRARGGSLRVPVERIERLLADLGELAQSTTNLEETVARSVESGAKAQSERAAIRQALRAIDRQIRSMHEDVLSARKVALAGLFDRLERTFRDACARTAKNARFVARGGETELDRSLVESLAEPLIHLVRNAVDHGLEDVPARRAAGKPERGTVRIEARVEGDHLELELSDDGRGIDHERVLARARELGLVPAGEDRTIDERIALIFHAGLSVKDHATALSGRGVGLDVVRESVARFGGVLDVATGDAGTVFRLRLPRSLAAFAALDVEAGGERYFLPLANVVRVIEVDERAGDDAPRVAEIDGRSVDVHELAPGGPRPGTRRGTRPAILLALADRRALLLVDRVGRRRDIVVRPLGDLLGTVPGIAGCAETSDGRSVLVLDPAALVDGSLPSAEGAR